MMATKEEERKAVGKIREIVESLGSESYVKFALDGTLEVAESNIENDWADGYKSRLAIFDKRIKQLLADKSELSERLKKAEANYDSLKEKYAILSGDVQYLANYRLKDHVLEVLYELVRKELLATSRSVLDNQMRITSYLDGILSDESDEIKAGYAKEIRALKDKAAALDTQMKDLSDAEKGLMRAIAATKGSYKRFI